jgi:hypothetical protein
MPIQTAVVQIIGGGGAAATAASVAIVALVADAAVTAGLAWGWGRRAAATYLLLGLALLGPLYARLDLIAVAFATWAFALARRGRDGPAGAAIAVAALWGLWAAFLLPWAALRRRRPTVVWALACLLLGGAAWFLVGGPKGPMQVLSYRGATGWDVQSTIGGFLSIFTDHATFLEGSILRIGYAPAAIRAAVLIAILGVTAFAWFRWMRTREASAGTTVLGVTAVILALSPTFPPAWASILAPWAAVAWEDDRRIGLGVAVVLALTGLIGAFPEHPVLGTLVIVRAVVLVWIAATSLTATRTLRTTQLV